MSVGYAFGEVARLKEHAVGYVFPCRGWRTVDLAGITLKVPAGWGEPEKDSIGFVIHNRPSRFRVDGDAVWYSSAIEVRARPIETPGSAAGSPMTEVSRRLPSRKGGHIVTAAFANGLSSGQRRVVDLVLKSARIAARPEDDRGPVTTSRIEPSNSP